MNELAEQLKEFATFPRSCIPEWEKCIDEGLEKCGCTRVLCWCNVPLGHCELYDVIVAAKECETKEIFEESFLLSLVLTKGGNSFARYVLREKSKTD